MGIGVDLGCTYHQILDIFLVHFSFLLEDQVQHFFFGLAEDQVQHSFLLSADELIWATFMF